MMICTWLWSNNRELAAASSAPSISEATFVLKWILILFRVSDPALSMSEKITYKHETTKKD
jgi:hypothetical protein